MSPFAPPRQHGAASSRRGRSAVALWVVTALLLLVGVGQLACATAHEGSVPTRPGPAPEGAGSANSVLVATVHFRPILGEVESNRRQLVQLTEQAARGGAKIIVHTEMATSGYSFFSREEISKVAETVPGPTTLALGQVARQYGAYVAVGLPQLEPRTGRYFNSAVLIGPDGNVAGLYHKRNNLLEASYNAEDFGPVPTFDTPYGRLGVVICADLFYSEFPRLAAVAGADILLAPANVGVEVSFLQVRAFEDDFALIVANRYGKEIQGTPRHVFDQNTFTIPSPFAYDFNYGSRSVIMTSRGEVLWDTSTPITTVGYGQLPIRTTRQFPVVRRPTLYPLLSQDTLESYTFSQFHLPDPAVFAAAAVNPGPAGNPWTAALSAAKGALAEARRSGETLKLIVYPQSYFPSADPGGIDSLQAFSRDNGIDLVLGIAGVPPASVMITPEGQTYRYLRTHRGRNEPIPPERLSSEYLVVDRPYARVALLQDRDLFAPETSVVMAKMGVDVLAVGADSAASVLSALWKSRTGDYLHIVVANKQGQQGIYLGGYISNPSYREGDPTVVFQMNTADVRNKKEPRFLDPTQLLLPCTGTTC